MGRFLLFAGETYYAKGGAHDLVDGFGSVVEAKAYGEALMEKDRYRFQWFHVFDIGTKSIVAKSASQALGAPRSDEEE